MHANRNEEINGDKTNIILRTYDDDDDDELHKTHF